MATPSPSDNTPDVDERDIPHGRQISNAVELTPNSVIVGIEVNSFAGSGMQVYPDFRTAVLDTWATGLEEADELREEPAKLREGRRAYKALLDRYEREGYQPGMGEELEQLNLLYGHDGWGISFSGALPDALGWVLDRCFPEPDYPEAMEGVPPLDEIDLNNPEHLELLQERLERALDF